MSNTLLTEETFNAEMAKKNAILQAIADSITASPYIYMSSNEYMTITPEADKLYWVLGDSGVHGIYKNGVLIEGTSVVSEWLRLQAMVRAGAISQSYSVGDQLTIKYNNTDELWDIVAFDVSTPADTSKTHSMTLMRHDLLADNMMFDNKEPNNSNSDRKNYGNNRYLHSNLRVWLNSSAAAGAWWTSQHTYDAAPDYASTKAGYMSGFESEFLDVLAEVKNKVVKNTVTDGGSYEEVTDTFFLASNTEVGLTNENSIAEGALFPYFSSNTQRTKTRTGQSSASYWWLRTPVASYSRSVRSVYSSGALNDSGALSTLGVCPACVIA